jgi:hypothetical protein
MRTASGCGYDESKSSSSTRYPVILAPLRYTCLFGPGTFEITKLNGEMRCGSPVEKTTRAARGCRAGAERNAKSAAVLG